MSQPVKTPQAGTAYSPAAEYCRLTLQEEDDLDDHRPACLNFKKGVRPECHHVVNVGLFFDGTNNNMERDYELNPRLKPPPVRSHSNIVRLYLAYPDAADNRPENSNQYFSYYMPGVGTPFEQIGEHQETQDGKAFAKGGQARILWAALQVYNAVHRTVYDDQPLFSVTEMAGLIKDYEQKVDYQRKPNPEDPPILRRDWFQPLTENLAQRLRERLLAKKLPSVPLVTLSVFGFSRGAVEARAFCYWYRDALREGLFAGIPTEIRFLGLFDSVASVGAPASMNEQFGLWMASGHGSWAAEILKPLPEQVRQTLHLMAAHEVRMNFPLTRVVGGNVEEWLFPGMHSDVGGGYAPGNQGRSRDGHAALLSQIPLLHMYRTALVAGVPLTCFDKLKKVVRDDFEVDPNLVSAFDLYLQDLGANGETSYETLVRQHMGLYYRWRSCVSATGDKAISAYATDPQDRQDLEESDLRMRWDVHLLALRASPNAMRTDRGGLVLSPQERAGGNQMPLVYAEAGLPLTPWERWALEIFRAQPERRQPGQHGEDALLQHYVHDSFAGFYLAGALTRFDQEEAFRQMCEKVAKGRPLNRFERRLYDLNPARAEREAEAIQTGTQASQDDELLIFPVMTDDDAPALRVAAVRLATNTRREGGGYFRQRWVYIGK
ncbi:MULTISPECIES: T6SS phospholipase effector Tle1-like catalytic domain-containing protein [Cupriavidus]